MAIDPDRALEIASEIAALVIEKNAAYGDAFGKSAAFLRLLYPNGIPVESYHDVMSIVRVWDKLMRIATDRTAMNENPWVDINGYSLLELVMSDERGSEDGA